MIAMSTDRIYFETSYLVRLYLEDRGFEKVRDLAATAVSLASAWHARAETIAALHRALREGRFPATRYGLVVRQFQLEQAGPQFTWFPLTEAIQERLATCFLSAPATTYLRSADALHLACAAVHGFKEVYSNDRHFLAAAEVFGLKGVNVIA